MAVPPTIKLQVFSVMLQTSVRGFYLFAAVITVQEFLLPINIIINEKFVFRVKTTFYILIGTFMAENSFLGQVQIKVKSCPGVRRKFFFLPPVLYLIDEHHHSTPSISRVKTSSLSRLSISRRYLKCHLVKQFGLTSLNLQALFLIRLISASISFAF